MTGLPDWLDPLYEADEMRAVDAWAIDGQGVPSLDLMERAGTGLARSVARVARPGPVRVVVGKGNKDPSRDHGSLQNRVSQRSIGRPKRR